MGIKLFDTVVRDSVVSRVIGQPTCRKHDLLQCCTATSVFLVSLKELLGSSRSLGEGEPTPRSTETECCISALSKASHEFQCPVACRTWILDQVEGVISRHTLNLHPVHLHLAVVVASPPGARTTEKHPSRDSACDSAQAEVIEGLPHYSLPGSLTAADVIGNPRNGSAGQSCRAGCRSCCNGEASVDVGLNVFHAAIPGHGRHWNPHITLGR